MSETRLAAQIYTVRDKIKEDPESLPEIFRKIREIGYRAVELVRQVIEDPALTRKHASDAGLEICSAHLSADRVFADPDYVIGLKEFLGTNQIVIPSMPKPWRGSADGARQMAEELQKAGERLAQEGITLSYHHHSFEFQKFDGKSAFQTILDLTKPEHVKIELDTYWVQHGGGDVAAWLRRLSDRISLLHLKDMGMVLRDQIYVEPGEGNLNWPAILDAARAANVRWYIVELDICPHDSFESLAISYRNCRAMGLE